jgi:hypothetical protein
MSTSGATFNANRHDGHSFLNETWIFAQCREDLLWDIFYSLSGTQKDFSWTWVVASCWTRLLLDVFTKNGLVVMWLKKMWYTYFFIYIWRCYAGYCEMRILPIFESCNSYAVL